ncbi:MAG: long-chain fatty acid transport protein [Cyclobacteriaceae bacterium]|nr:long-chain fatty acid transport protein [Cyclobacteriaceae bacterium]
MKKLYTLFPLLWVTFTAFAQDGHYWTQQYGTKSMLLSGSVIGGVEDLGAVYYNPGRLALIKNPAFLLSASVYEYNSLSASDALGAKQNVSKSEIKGVPTLAAGTFKLKFLPGHHFAYAIMTRQLADLSFSYKNEVNTDVFDTVSLPGDEWFNGDVGFKTKGNEQWVGLTWSHSLSKKISIGVTTNLVSNSQTKGSNIYLRALSTAVVDTPRVATYQYSRNYDYTESGLLWKIGLAGQFGLWNLGLTIKTPMVRFSGSGNYSFERYYSTMPGIKRQTEIYTSSNQSGLELKSRTPWAIGFGATRAIGKNKIHLSTEYYTAISKYTLMQAQDHVSQSNPSTTEGFTLTDEAKSVWNAGIGAEIFINQNISGFASFSTDFSSVSNDITRFIQNQKESSNNAWKADFYNFGGGVVLDFKGVDLTLGVTHTGARQTIPRVINFPEEGGGGDILDTTQTSDLKWDRWRFVFSFSFPFLADMAKKMQSGGEGEKK